MAQETEKAQLARIDERTKRIEKRLENIENISTKVANHEFVLFGSKEAGVEGLYSMVNRHEKIYWKMGGALLVFTASIEILCRIFR